MIECMDLWRSTPLDALSALTEERADLLDFIAGLNDAEWHQASTAPGWSVKDLALHLLDDDLGWLSRGRDGDRSGRRDVRDHATFVDALAVKNQRWIDGTQQLSRPVVVGLLQWAGDQMDAYYASIDPMSDGWVTWASDAPVPQWFDIAQDLTERWVHQQQMRQAVGKIGPYCDKYLPLILQTFVCAVPHQYRVLAPLGTTLALDLSQGGRWSIRSDGDGRWALDQADAPDADLRVTFNDEGGWRWLTGAAVPDGGIVAEGDPVLLPPLLAVRGILA